MGAKKKNMKMKTKKVKPRIFHTIESFDNTGYLSWGDYMHWSLEFIKQAIVKRYGQDSCSGIMAKMVDIRMNYEKNKLNSKRDVKRGLPILNVLYEPNYIMKPILYSEVYKEVNFKKLGEEIGVRNSSPSASYGSRRRVK
jgi:hypothetical protein